MSATTSYVPLDGRRWHHTMGLRPLELARWLEFGADADDQIAQKAILLANRPREVVATCDESTDACVELRDAITENLGTFHPARTRTPDLVEHPLVAASRLVAEDLCVLAKRNDSWTLVAACVCFPSRWSLSDKIGTNLDAIHDPVPGFAETLARPTNQFFDRLRADRPFWRLNWTLLDDAELFQPQSKRGRVVADPAQWLFRVERQTIRLLTETNAAIFTIRTYVTRALDVATTEPSFVRDVQMVLETAPTATLQYKGWVGLADLWRERFRDAT